MNPICAELVAAIDAKLLQNGLHPSSDQMPDAVEERARLLWRLYLTTEERMISSYEELMTMQELYDIAVDEAKDLQERLEKEKSLRKAEIQQFENEHKKINHMTDKMVEVVNGDNNSLLMALPNVEKAEIAIQTIATDMETVHVRCLDELKDKDLEVCKLQDCVKQLQQENSEAKMLLDEEGKKHKIAMDAIKQELHTNSLEADNTFVAIQSQVDTLKMELENTLDEMDKKQRCLDELKDKDLEVCKLQDCVKQLQQENSDAKMLLDEQEKNHKITMDAIRQELHTNSLEADNKLMTIQSQVDALMKELHNTVDEMDKKQRCLDDLKDKDLKLQDCVKQLQQENSDAKMLLNEQEKNHKITMDAIKQELHTNSLEADNTFVAIQSQVEALKMELENTLDEMDKKQRCLDEMKDKDLEVCKLQDCVKQLQQENSEAKMLLDEQEKKHKITMDEQEKNHKITMDAIKQELHTNSLEADNKLVAIQSQVDALNTELENTVDEMDKKQRCLDDLKDKDLEVCKLQDCVKQLQQENSEAKMLLDEQEKNHKIAMDAIKQEIHVNNLKTNNKLVASQSEVEALRKSMKRSLIEREKMQQYLDELKDKDLEVCRLQECLDEQENNHSSTVDAFKEEIDFLNKEVAFAEESNVDLEKVKAELEKLNAELDLKNQQLHANSLEADNKLVATQSQVEALKMELENTVMEMDKKQRCLDEMKDKDLEVCELQDCVTQLQEKNNLDQELLDEQKKHHKISMADAIKEKVELLNAKIEMKDKDLEICELQDCVKQLQEKNNLAQELLDDQKKHHKISMNAIKETVEHLNRRLDEEHKADKKQQPNQDDLQDYKALAEAQEKLLQDRAEEISEMNEMMNHYDAHLNLSDEKLVLAKERELEMENLKNELEKLKVEVELKNQQLHANSLEADNKLVATQSQVEALKKELQNTVDEMDKKQRCLDELKDKDLEVCKLQDCVKQLQQENSDAKMLLDEQEKNHKITMDAIKQELHDNSLEADNKLMATQSQVEALKMELETTVDEMDKKQRFFDELTDKELEVCELQDCVKQLQQKNNLAQELLDEQKKHHKISMADAIKEKVELLNAKIEMKDKDLEICELQDCVKQLQQKNNLAQELLDDQKKHHKISMDAIKETVEHLNRRLDEEHKADKKQQPNQDDLKDYKALAEAQEKLLQDRAEEISEMNEMMNHYDAHLKLSDEKLVLAKERELEMENLKNELGKLKVEVELKNQQLHANSLEADNKLVATQSQVEALKKELENTVDEMDKKQRCLDEMKDKDLEVCELQDCVKHLQQKNNLAQELLDEQKKQHKISMDAIKEKVELLNAKMEEHKADKKQQPNQDALHDYKALAEGQEKQFQNKAEEHSEMNKMMNRFTTHLEPSDEKLVLAKERDLEMENLKNELGKLKVEVELKNQQLHANSIEADNKLVATQSQVDTLKKELHNTVDEMDKKQRCLDELTDKDLEVCRLQHCLDEQEKKYKITVDSFKQEVDFLQKEVAFTEESNVDLEKVKVELQKLNDKLELKNQQLHANILEAENKLVATQSQVEALKMELENTVMEMDKKQRCLDELKDKDLEVCKLQDCLKQLQQENSDVKMLLDEEEKTHKITMDAIKQEVDFLHKEVALVEESNVDLEKVKAELEKLNAELDLKNQQLHANSLEADNKLVATQSQVEALKMELENTVMEMDKKQRCLDELKDKDLEVCKLQDCLKQLQQENSEAKMLLDEQEKTHKITMDAIKQEVDFLNKEVALAEDCNVDLEKLHTNSLEADNKLVASQSQIEALKMELEKTVTEMDKKQRYLDELKDKDLEVCELQDCVKHLQQKNNLAKELLDKQKKEHKISMDAIKEKEELLNIRLDEEHEADKKQQANQDALKDYKYIAENQERLLQERAEQISEMKELINHYAARLQSTEKKYLDELKDKDLEVCELQDCVKHLQQKNNLAQELLDMQKKQHKISMYGIKEKVELLNIRLDEEHKAGKKQQANQDALKDYKYIPENQERLLQEKAEEISELKELVNHYAARLQSKEEKLVLTDKERVAALSKAEALEKELIQTLKETSQKRSKYYDQIYKLRDRLSDTKDQHKREIERRDDKIKEQQRRESLLTRKVEKLTETTEMMDKVNTELLREKRQFYRDLNGDFLV